MMSPVHQYAFSKNEASRSQNVPNVTKASKSCCSFTSLAKPPTYTVAFLDDPAAPLIVVTMSELLVRLG